MKIPAMGRFVLRCGAYLITTCRDGRSVQMRLCVSRLRRQFCRLWTIRTLHVLFKLFSISLHGMLCTPGLRRIMPPNSEKGCSQPKQHEPLRLGEATVQGWLANWLESGGRKPLGTTGHNEHMPTSDSSRIEVPASFQLRSLISRHGWGSCGW